VQGSLVKPGKAFYILAMLLTLLYLYLMNFWPPVVRLARAGVSAAVVVAIFKPDLSTWFPVILLLAVVGGVPFSMGEFHPNPVTLIAFAFFVLYLFRRVFWGGARIMYTPTVKMVFAALILQTATVFISVHVNDQYYINAIREGYSIYMMLPAMLIVADLYRDREAFERFIKYFLAMLLLASVIGLIQQSVTTGFSRTDLSTGYLVEDRFSGSFGGPNEFSGFLELTVPVALAVALSARSKLWRLIGLVVFGLGLICVLYTFSRGGFAATVLGSLFLLVVRFRKKLWVPLLALVLFSTAIITNRDTFARQVNLMFNPRQVVMEPTLLHRYVTYGAFWDDFAERPWTGRGWGAREFYWGRTRLFSFWEVRHTRSIHKIDIFGGLNSLFLNNAVKGGILSVTALILIGIGAITAGVRAFRRSGSFLALGITVALVSFGIHQLVDNLIQWPQISVVFWINIGLLLCMAGFGRDKADRAKSVFL
jgi:hypothetical protein